MTDKERADHFVYQPGDALVCSQCIACAHAGPNNTCKAFPQGIPGAILNNGADHREPYPGDGGIQFKPAYKGAGERVARWLRLSAE